MGWCHKIDSVSSQLSKNPTTPTFAESRINQAETIQRTFVDANARTSGPEAINLTKKKKHSGRHSYSIAQMMTQSFISLQNTGTRLLGKMLMGEEVVE